MVEGPDLIVVPGIAALPPSTARQIGSGQVLVDPSSVVKELIDNSLDARAKSIFVGITANTIDSIQVKDDGHGIATEDRPLVCRRFCTSKIRDFHDLREVGRKWLGFRGEALSSMAEMSSSLYVTTRVEGEPVAVKLKYGRDGELASVEHDSHPVGTTVKVTNFLDSIPVRKQTASKNSAKLLAKIRRLMQAYALARPTIRFRLRVLEAKNNNGDFVYAPKAGASIEDAALKVVGKDCAMQCDWTVLEADGFEVHAFLPKPGATGPKVAHQGAFISIDARPVSNSRGTIKQIVAAYKDRLRTSNPSLTGVKNPFFCLNIICPPDSYDPNIEPAKDSVMFENNDIVVGVVDKLLKAHYPEAVQGVQDVQDAELPTPAQQQYETQPEQLFGRIESSIMIHDDKHTSFIEEPSANLKQALLRWRSSMYGIDEDDLEFLQEDHAPVIEEEDGLPLPAEVSNPWTIARMNTMIKPTQSISNGQPPSPAKSQGGSIIHPSSSGPVVTPYRVRSALPLTPQTLSRANDDEMERSVHHLPQPSSGTSEAGESARGRTTNIHYNHEFSTCSLQAGKSNHFTQSDVHPADSRLSNFGQSGTSPQSMAPLVHSPPPRGRHAHQAYANKPFAPLTREPYDAGVGKPLPGTQSFKSAHHQHATMSQRPRLPTSTSTAPRKPVPNATECTTSRQLYSNNNSDIRDFFGCSRDSQAPGSSVTCINSEAPTHQRRGRPSRRSQRTSQRNAPIEGFSRAFSAEPQPRSKRDREYLLIDDDSGTNADLRNTTRQFQIHDQASPHSPTTPRPSGAQSEPPLVSQRSRQVAATPDVHHFDNSDNDMEAYFMSQEQQHTRSPSRPKKVSHRHESRIAPPHESLSKICRPRRRMTDALERTKSSTLPLECRPKGFHIQDLIFSLPIDIHTIVQCSCKLDMQRNSPEWGYRAEDTYGVFAEPIFDKKIMEWVIKLDAQLTRRYEKLDGADTRCEIYEGIQRALDARKEANDAMPRVESMDQDAVDGAVGVFEKDVYQNDGIDASVAIQQPATEAERKVDGDDEVEIDMEQFVRLTTEEKQIMWTPDEGKVEAGKVKYDEDIEDEMLMDL